LISPEQTVTTRADNTTVTDHERATPEPQQKRVHIRTFGCQMNVYDSERMTEALAAQGYIATETPDDADLVVLNTCHIREKAVDKVYSDLGRLREIKDARAKKGHETVITVAGCVAQAEGKEIIRRMPSVDVVVGPQAYHRLPDLITKSRKTGRAQIETDFADDQKFKALPERAHDHRAPEAIARAAFLTIQEGCDKFCTFCVVPYTRGAEYSRSVADVVKEAEKLVARGVREVTLLGQNVNAYHGLGANGAAVPLEALTQRLAAIDGLARIRYTTSHPRDMTDALIDAHITQPKLMPYLHLPFQAGSDRILKAMNRKHTIADYRATIAKVRKARPDIALSTDIIVGFPGETAQEFEATMDLVREVTFAQAYSFVYSPRPGTPAANLEDTVPEDEKRARLHKLQALLFAQQKAFNESVVGRTLPVLFEKPGRNPGQLIGRSPYLQSVHATADRALIGQIVNVKITYAQQNSVGGDIV
jgi:tRNA-2-methylthio-N6-dimethylallyladenosine synthase